MWEYAILILHYYCDVGPTVWYWQYVLYTAIDRYQLYNTVRLTAANSAQNNTEIGITKQTLNILRKKETKHFTMDKSTYYL